ncbi:MAG: sucrase ferredoxin [Nakamurella sp.]
MISPPRCSEASLAAGNDPAGSSSAFRSFLLVTDTGAWGKSAADAAAAGRLDPSTAGWVSSNREGLRPFAIRPVQERRGADSDRFLAGTVGDGDALRGWQTPPTSADLQELVAGRWPGETVDGPLIGICTNGSRDRCCALGGRPIALELAASIGDGRVTEISHLGGHRFAGTLVVLPWGYSYGFLDPDSAAAVADDAMSGLVHPRQLRGRANLSPAAQAAEIAWRAELGAAAPSAVAITREQVDGEVTTVTATVDGRTEQLNMRYLPGERITETACGGKPFGTGRWLAETD